MCVVEKGVLWFWLVSVSTSVTMAAKIPMTSFSLALHQLQRGRLGLVGDEWTTPGAFLKRVGRLLVDRAKVCTESARG